MWAAGRDKKDFLSDIREKNKKYQTRLRKKEDDEGAVECSPSPHERRQYEWYRQEVDALLMLHRFIESCLLLHDHSRNHAETMLDWCLVLVEEISLEDSKPMCLEPTVHADDSLQTATYLCAQIPYMFLLFEQASIRSSPLLGRIRSFTSCGVI